MSLSGCVESLNVPNCIWFEAEEKRNAIASVVAGLLFFIGWWFIIDVQSTNAEHFHGAYHLCGIFGTISLFMVNAVSNAQMRGDAYGGGCMGPQGARAWLFLGFVMGFAADIAACWILFDHYVAGKAASDKDKPTWPGIGLFLQNSFIFIASLVYKFGRTEEQW